MLSADRTSLVFTRLEYIISAVYCHQITVVTAIKSMSRNMFIDAASQIYFKCKQLLLKKKNFLREDPDFFWMQNLSRFQCIRRWLFRQRDISNLVNASMNTSSSTNSAIFTDDPLSIVHKTLYQDGYYQGIRLTPVVLKSLLKFAEEQPCYGDRNHNLKFWINQRSQIEKSLGRSLYVASYLDSHETCKAFQQLRQDAIINAIAAQYLGQEPKYHRGELLWSFPRISTYAEKMSLAQVMHCDINDYRTVKFFFYLTDVDSDSGPHIYLKGSHLNRSLWHQILGQHIASIPDEVLIQKYGSDRRRTIYGSAGFGFAADPYTLHQGSTPHKKPRLLLQFEFGIKQYKVWYFKRPTA